jgi:hypothetical protein
VKVPNTRHVSRFGSGSPALTASQRLHGMKSGLGIKIGLLKFVANASLLEISTAFRQVRSRAATIERAVKSVLRAEMARQRGE